MNFVIEYVASVAMGGYVFARQTAPGDFMLGEGASLGGIPIEPHVTQPRATIPGGTLRSDVFAFVPVEPNATAQLSIGQMVTLKEGNAG